MRCEITHCKQKSHCVIRSRETVAESRNALQDPQRTNLRVGVQIRSSRRLLLTSQDAVCGCLEANQIKNLTSAFIRAKFDQIRTKSRVSRLFEVSRGLFHDLRSLAAHHKNLTDLVQQINSTRRRDGTRRMRTMMLTLTRQISRLAHYLREDECLSRPCKNGATCLDQFDKYLCLCPPHFTGPNCEFPIDECADHKGTVTGCQNNGTCENTKNGLKCHCPKGFHGALCQTRSNACEFSLDLCGEHGHCIPNGLSAGEVSYKCLCEWGFRQSNDTDNPICEDIDECEANPCHPGADCINLPGSFRCSGCPRGTKGNGVLCTDVDECSDDDLHDCSKQPKVACLNTFGSFTCGPCPAGYEGDGKICSKHGACADNPCHPMARCIEMTASSLSLYRCECPSGFTGNGVGGDGCAPFEHPSKCTKNCQYGGSCVMVNGTDTCQCATGRSGPNCEYIATCGHMSACSGHGNCSNYDPNTGILKCKCNTGFYGQFCENEASGCSFYTTNATGVINYPPAPDSYWACIWMFDIPNKTFIEFTMSNYSYPGTDGHGGVKFHSKGDTYIVNSTNLYKQFTLAMRTVVELFHPGHGLTFSLKWEAKSASCGIHIYPLEQPYTTIVRATDEDIYCIYDFEVLPNYKMEVIVEDIEFQTGAIENCTINSIEVLANPNHIKETTHICGNRPAFRETATAIRIKFTNRRLLTPKNCKTPSCRSSFRITVKPSKKPGGCGGVINLGKELLEGTLTAPGYDSEMEITRNDFCMWVINSTALSPSPYAKGMMDSQFYGFRISTEVLEMDMPSTKNGYCTHSSLSFPVDEFEFSAIPYERRYCDSRKPIDGILSDGPVMKVAYERKDTGRGFKLAYKSDCNHFYFEPNGTIQSPHYPQSSPVPYKCTYTIYSQATNAIRLRFNYIGVKTDLATCFYRLADQDKLEDYIEFSGGHTANEQINRRYVCPKYPFVMPMGEMVTSAQRPLVITYSTSGSSDNTGFLFEYQTIDVGCGGVFSEDTGVITSPNYPEKYLAHMYCIYQIVVNPNKRVRLTFEVFDLEIVSNREECGFDSVRVFDSFESETVHGKEHGKFCGSMTPPSLLSDGNKMTVVFVSDRSVSGTGFSARWQSIDDAIDCDRTFTASSGRIEFEAEKFRRVTQCDYHIALPSAHRILLKIENISAPCDQASLTVKNGLSDLSPSFGGLYGNSEICDDHPVEQLRSQGNRLFLRFRTSNARATSFNVTYEQIDSGCGGTMSGMSGAISAPQYPLKDSRSQNCKWHIAVANGNKIRFQISLIDDLNSADTSGFCSVFAPNLLDVADGPDGNANILRRICKKETGASLIDSETNEIVVRYKQHGGSHFPPLFGFLAHYSTICTGITLTEHHGILQSPGYPENTLDARQCKWKIKTSAGNRIRLTFHHFRVTDLMYSRFSLNSNTHMCSNNFLEIKHEQLGTVHAVIDGIRNDSTTLERFCDKSGEPISLLTKSNEVDISFVSRNDPENHFWLSWSTEGCGGTYVLNGSSFDVRINDLQENAPLFECEWTVKAPIGLRIKANIEKFNMFTSGGSADCVDDENFNGIKFHSGMMEYPQKMVCDALNDFSYTSHSNELTVRLRMKREYAKFQADGRFLMGKFIFVEPEIGDSCGSVLKVTKENPVSIHSPEYPKAYPKSVSCKWKLTSPPGSNINFHLLHYKTPNYHPNRPVRRLWRHSNVTCDMPLPLVEGAISFKHIDGKIIDRICLDINETKHFATFSSQAIVEFDGAPYDRSHISGSDPNLEKIGFVLNVTVECGGTLYAREEKQSLSVGLSSNFVMDQCKLKVVQDPQIPQEDEDEIAIELVFLAHMKKVPAATMIDVICGATKIGLLEYSPSNDTISHTFRCASSEELFLTFTELSELPKGHILINYNLNEIHCGGELHGLSGTTKTGLLTKSSECIYTASAGPGNQVELQLIFNLPPSEFCVDSYLEVRKHNSSGEKIGRWCGHGQRINSITGEDLWIKVRYQQDEEDDGPSIWAATIKHESRFGGETESRVIQYKPPAHAIHVLDTLAWTIGGKPGDYLKITIDDVQIPPTLGEQDMDNSFRLLGLVIVEEYCESQDVCGSAVAVVDGWNPPEHEIIVPNSVATIRLNAEFGSSFRLHWTPLHPSIANKTRFGGSEEDESDYNCGGELIPTYESQYLTHPTSLTGAESGYTSTIRGGYPNNAKCRWSLRRPILRGLQFRIISVEMEEHVDCRFDFLMFSSKSYKDSTALRADTFARRFCKSKLDRIRTLDFTYDNEVYIYFSSDRSRGGRGFKIEYRLSCTSFDYIPLTFGRFDEILTSPGYPNSYRKNETCLWSIMLESNRPLTAEVIDLQIEKTGSTCEGDYLQIMSEYSSYAGPATKRICGVEKENMTSPDGRLNIRFVTDGRVERKGLSIRISEKIHDCGSEHLHLTEDYTSKVLEAPGFPSVAPNSLDCSWTLRGPPGRRIKFTVDPVKFDLQTAAMETCDDDFMEIRDGASLHAPLVGRFCRQNPPSTVFSTGSYLHVRFVTDSQIQSEAWNATYAIASCGGSLVLSSGVNATVSSPNFPEPYPSEADCEWNVRAPNNHFVNVSFNHLWMIYSENCSLDYVTIKDGNSTGADLIPKTCNMNQVRGETFHSTRNTMHVKFLSNSTTGKRHRMFCLSRKCGFELEVAATKISCGGKVTDDSGMVYTPGYPNELMKHINCKWTFDAGIGFRYLLQLEFLDGENGFYEHSFLPRFYIAPRFSPDRDSCFPDLSIVDGGGMMENNGISTDRYFCSNRTTFVSSADKLSLLYSDQTLQFLIKNKINNVFNQSSTYRPFHVKYTKVPSDFDENGCQYSIERNSTLTLRNLTMDNSPWSRTIPTCHIQINRPNRDGTTLLEFRNFSVGHFTGICNEFDSYVAVNALDDPLPVSFKVCNASMKNSGNASYSMSNQVADLVLANKNFGYFNLPRFELKVTFYECGGFPEESEGVITSPNFGGDSVYPENVICIWNLQAPVGQIVMLNFTHMDLEHHVECDHDVLIVYESGPHSVIHRYCNNMEADPMPERFQVVRSHGRHISLEFRSDSSLSMSGFRVEYSYVSASDGCGFVTHKMSGHIMSPEWPKDYANDLRCLWDISVPLGYHVQVTFEEFDVAESDACKKDSLQISEEHQSRAMAPVGGYYFFYDYEDHKPPMCGSDLPKVYDSESNRIRLNFTTDARSQAKGFKLNWKATCGTVYRLNHGVLTSPHFPDYYPNEDRTCEYLISPDYSNGVPVVTVKILELELDQMMGDYSRTPCKSDYLELRDVVNKRVIGTYCTGQTDLGTQNSLSIRGPVGVKFVTNATMNHDKVKRFKGFKLSYALAECGGEIKLKENAGSFSKTLSSPGFPLPYHHDMECVWNITAPANRIISVKFTDFDIEMSNDCRFDYVELFNGINETEANSLGKLCGDVLPPSQMFSTGRNMVVKFKSDRSNAKAGFRLVLTPTLGEDMGCGGTFNATMDWKILKSPLTGKGTYFDDLRCGWTVEAPAGKILEMKFTKIDLEKNKETGNCDFDFIHIYDGYKVLSPFLAEQICQIPDSELSNTLTYFSSYRMAYLYFETDSSESAGGFELQYRAVDSDCGGALAAEDSWKDVSYQSDKALTRTNQRYKRCRTFIYSRKKTPIEIEFEEFSFPAKSAECADEFMEIRDVGAKADCEHPACMNENDNMITIRTCGETLPAKFISRSAVVQITTSAILQSQHTVSYKIRYMNLGNCNRTVEVTGNHLAGRLTSPNYPNRYDANSSCTSSLQASQEYRILFVFKTFTLERSSVRGYNRYTFDHSWYNDRWRPDQTRPPGVTRGKCDYDYVQFFDGNNNGSAKFCDSGLPPSMFSNASVVSVYFKSDSTMSRHGYDLYYYSTLPKEVTAPGETTITEYNFAVIREKQGAVTNIGFPYGYPANSTMRWTIAPPSGHKCTFEATKVDICSSGNNTEAVGDRLLFGQAVGSGPEAADIDIKEFNNDLVPLPCTVAEDPELSVDVGSFVRLEFTTDGDSTNDGQGFRIEWECENYAVPQV
ncbi:hypothetical protein L596_017729 [Steinernema carpocapsae]|uniref:Cubilin n=1 Tax=Steinernema carpocapsae TaxID=34508 RepID=A0A4V6A1U5_STECR|nr:hypothetical protein L596_017729 [Steinernema carpocapsae]